VVLIELCILEFRSIVREFLDEAKRIPFLSGHIKTFPTNATVAPVELGAAAIFDLHLGAAVDIPACDGAFSGSSDPTACLTAAQSTQLFTQRNLGTSTATINTLSNQAKSLGLGNLNAYLALLGESPVDFSTLSNPPNFLQDLQGSAAEYAFNFGILEQIYAQDSRSDSANATCLANLQFVNNVNTQQFQNALNSFIPLAKNRTMCTLFQSMEALAGGIGAVPLHPRMFIQETATGSC